MGSEEVDHRVEADSDEHLIIDDRLKCKSLTIISKSFVKPASDTPSEKQWLALTNLDMNWVPFYTPLLCIYKDTPAGVDLGQRLRDSLAKVLVLFYPLGGRLVTSGDLPPTIHCNDAGAVFVEASIDADIRELKYEDFQPSFALTGMAEAGLGSYPRLPDDMSERPTLVVQMTHFKCGGVTLASNWAHPVADGQSGFHFMKSWAELARGEDVSLLPVHDRELVKPRTPLILSDPFSLGSEFPNGNGRSKENHLTHTDSKLHNGSQHEQPSPQSKITKKETALQVKVFDITKEEVEWLKREVDSGAVGDSPPFSRVVCVSAHFWRSTVEARKLSRKDRVRFWILVEGRKRMSLPPGYFGNVIGPMVTGTTVGDLLDKPLSFSASLVHNAVQHATKDWYQDLVDWSEGKKSLEHPGIILGPDHECGCSWQNRFPYYELNFGFGVPVCSMRNANAAWDGLFVFVPSCQSSENFTVFAHTPPDVMSRFLPLVHNK